MEILKLLLTVQQIYEKGYIHGDIKPHNVMCNFNTGELTIIDFDKFHKYDEFVCELDDMRLYFAHPPETLALSYSFLDLNNKITLTGQLNQRIKIDIPKNFPSLNEIYKDKKNIQTIVENIFFLN